MRPPDLSGGNWRPAQSSEQSCRASMRPPDLSGGNPQASCTVSPATWRFNEAAGFIRRKPEKRPSDTPQPRTASMRPPDLSGGNPESSPEPTDRTWSASMRPPDLSGGNGTKPTRRITKTLPASMRPPDLSGGNPPARPARPPRRCSSFNEAAGFIRRKPRHRRRPRSHCISASMRPPDLSGGNRCRAVPRQSKYISHASMRPPDLSGGNMPVRTRRFSASTCFNEAAGFIRRKRAAWLGRRGQRSRFNEAAGFIRRKLEAEVTLPMTPQELQ